MSCIMKIKYFHSSHTFLCFSWFEQCRSFGWEDLRYRRHCKQRGSGAGQHGGLWPLRQRLDTAAEHAMPTLQARLCGHQEVHSEWLMLELSNTRCCCLLCTLHSVLPRSHSHCPRITSADIEVLWNISFSFFFPSLCISHFLLFHFISPYSQQYGI